MADHAIGQKPTNADKQRPPLRRYLRAFCLLVFYIPLILMPWIVTLVLAYRPLSQHTYAYAPGFSKKEYHSMQAWAKAIPILNSIASILTVPITSALIAQAAVVFAQRRYPTQQLSVRHLLSLADRTWLDLGALNNSRRWKEPGSWRVKGFLFASAGLVILSAVQYPLYQLLAPWQAITVPTCADTAYIRGTGYITEHCDFQEKLSDGRSYLKKSYVEIGADLEPAQMAAIPASHALALVKTDLSKVSQKTVQPNLWREPGAKDSPDHSRYSSLGDVTGFVAGLPADTTTGVLREHIMRLNSSVSCVSKSTSEYPATCSGSSPVQASYSYDGGFEPVTADICAPGNSEISPWRPDRNLQEISEEVYFKITGFSLGADMTIHCTARTTRGYFELGNTHNGGSFGPLLEKWPHDEYPYGVLKFNDYFGFEAKASNNYTNPYIPSEEDHMTGAAIPEGASMPGPLMTVIASLFGNDSWARSVEPLVTEESNDLKARDTDDVDPIVSALLQPICDRAPFPEDLASSSYFNESCSDNSRALFHAHYHLYSLWNDKSIAESRLHTALFLANKAALTANSGDQTVWRQGTGREIYFAPGLTVLKPEISLPAQVVLSVFIFIQLIGLLWLGWFIYTAPTWTPTLDAMAVARIGASVDPSLLPPFGEVGQREHGKLAHTDGLVGVQSIGEISQRTHHEAGESEVELVDYRSEDVKQHATSAVVEAGQATVLGLGAPGYVSGPRQRSPGAGQGDV